MINAIAEGRALFTAWAQAYHARQRHADSPQWARYDRAEQTAWDTLIDTVEANHDPKTCTCHACQVWRADAPADVLKQFRS